MADLQERLIAALGERYAIQSEIGRGGMATVFLAEDLKHHRRVAIKVLHPELVATLGAERFLQEIEIIARLQHPHILPLHDSGEADGLLYFVMPYVEGESLRQRLDRERQLAVDESVRIAIEVADGLDYAHRQGVVHRDIKPANILLSDRHAVIADFGIARAVEAAQTERITRTGLGVGTPLYASPEQATAEETLDGRTDIYALGCVLYEMLAGEPPFTGATPQAIQARRVSETPSPLHGLRDTVPPALDHVIARSLARVPADRFATASQFAQALQAVLIASTPSLHTDPSATPAAVAMTPTAVTTEPARKARRWWLLAIPVLAVALLAVLWPTSKWSGGEQLELTASNMMQVTDASGIEFQPAMSPTGDEVAFVFGPIWSPRLAVRSTRDIGRGGETRPGSDEPGKHWLPAWTASGSSLRFFVDAPGIGWQWKEVGKLGGTVRTVQRPWPGSNSLSHDGNLVISQRSDSIYIYESDYGEPELLAVHPGGTSDIHSFAWSLDDQRIAYVDGNGPWRYSANVSDSEIWVVEADGGTPTRVTQSASLNVSPQWLPDNRHLLFVSDRDGLRGVYVVEVDANGHGSEPRRISGVTDPHSVSTSIDGRRLAFSKFNAVQNIWSVSIPRSGSVSIREAVPVTRGNRVIEAHSPSPDGESIAFGMGVRGVYDIYRMPIRGGDLELIVSTGDHVFDPAWSPDGAEIAFDGHSTRPDGLGAVWVVSALGGTPIQVADFPGYDNKQDWSPDGLTIAFASSGPEGRGGQKIWTVSRAETGQPWGTPEQLTEDPCWWPDWAPDGTSLVCDSGVGLVRVSTSGTVLWRLELSPVMVTVDQPHFSLDGSKIYFLAEHQDGRRGIWSIPSDGGEATVVVAFDDPSLTVLSYLSLDAERFYLTIGEYESDIWVADLDW